MKVVLYMNGEEITKSLDVNINEDDNKVVIRYSVDGLPSETFSVAKMDYISYNQLEELKYLLALEYAKRVNMLVDNVKVKEVIENDG